MPWCSEDGDTLTALWSIHMMPAACSSQFHIVDIDSVKVHSHDANGVHTLWTGGFEKTVRIDRTDRIVYTFFTRTCHRVKAKPDMTSAGK
ncbi:hypothetical protein ElyMa_000104800 [Elysia marginata]|uniref:Uncharacterized protein n=1 Tax=Elysia marginata TaxID=1093978 RepID=A0AAV4EM13_9GAST|nr:hypothetical protein ElyMa_000104800 [Elysia marginata]